MSVIKMHHFNSSVCSNWHSSVTIKRVQFTI